MNPSTASPGSPITPGRVGRLTREQLIGQIQAINPTASAEYLDAFPTTALLTYLERLLCASEPRSGLSRWIRTGAAPAISRFEPVAD